MVQGTSGASGPQGVRKYGGQKQANAIMCNVSAEEGHRGRRLSTRQGLLCWAQPPRAAGGHALYFLATIGQ